MAEVHPGEERPGREAREVGPPGPRPPPPVARPQVAQQDADEEVLAVLQKRPRRGRRQPQPVERQRERSGGEHDPAGRGRQSEHGREQRHQQVELDLDLQAPGVVVDRAGLAVDQFVDVAEARQQVGPQVAPRALAEGRHEQEEEQHRDDVGGLEPREPPPGIAPQVDRRRPRQGVPAERQGEHEAADHEEQVDAVGAERDQVADRAVDRRAGGVAAAGLHGPVALHVQGHDGRDREAPQAVDFRQVTAGGRDPAKPGQNRPRHGEQSSDVHLPRAPGPRARAGSRNRPPP